MIKSKHLILNSNSQTTSLQPVKFRKLFSNFTQFARFASFLHHPGFYWTGCILYIEFTYIDVYSSGAAFLYYRSFIFQRSGNNIFIIRQYIYDSIRNIFLHQDHFDFIRNIRQFIQRMEFRNIMIIIFIFILTAPNPSYYIGNTFIFIYKYDLNSIGYIMKIL